METIISCVGAKASTATPACLYTELARSVFIYFFIQKVTRLRFCRIYLNPNDELRTII